MTDSTYSPRRRTALVLSGTGTAGAYHAGVLSGLDEAGVKIDLVAGRGVGVVGALFAAVDGGARLWAANGPWRRARSPRFYRFRAPLRIAAWALLAGLAALLSPLVFLLVAVLAWIAELVASLVGLASASPAIASWAHAVLAAAFSPDAVPAVMPRAVALAFVVALVAVGLGALADRRRGGRRGRGAPWWRLAGAPLSARRTAADFRRALWHLIRGAASLPEPGPGEIGRRYAELVLENLGQPGFREVLLLAHDLDARQDVVFALVGEPARRSFFSAARRVEAGARTGEAFDLAGAAGDHVTDALAAALSLPAVAEPHPATFQPESYWRGETHRLCDRPEGVARLLDEAQAAGVEQVVLVTDAPPPAGPHALDPARRALKARLGEYFRSAETAAIADALRGRADRGPAVFVIRPTHNPVGPFDFRGADDLRSDRRHGLSELVDRGYEDAYRQFIEPVVGAGADPPDAVRESRPARTRRPKRAPSEEDR